MAAQSFERKRPLRCKQFRRVSSLLHRAPENALIVWFCFDVFRLAIVVDWNRCRCQVDVLWNHKVQQGVSRGKLNGHENVSGLSIMSTRSRHTNQLGSPESSHVNIAGFVLFPLLTSSRCSIQISEKPWIVCRVFFRCLYTWQQATVQKMPENNLVDPEPQ